MKNISLILITSLLLIVIGVPSAGFLQANYEAIEVTPTTDQDDQFNQSLPQPVTKLLSSFFLRLYEEIGHGVQLMTLTEKTFSVAAFHLFTHFFSVIQHQVSPPAVPPSSLR